MKKIVLLAALLSAFGIAQAVELGVTGGRDYAQPHSNDYGITLGQKFGKFGVTAEYDDVKHVGVKENRYGLLGGYDLYTFKGNTLTAKFGGEYISSRGLTSGYAGVVGAGLTFPISKSVALTADYRYQQAQKRIDTYTGNNVSAGIKVSF
jgi:outer membrane autotransporter protein